ncbi:ABC transporter permease [Dyadobacter sp. CY312]|uniref:ABC transporter permease n=1 Tax=Dyadobacter sp. CY312 TaxID=2907303 RepID=UPI001F357314|nr:ABC transporter permease [Dyadobacter sp. CY312]MCE7041717.1 ABC transporter permease [Dyadobacter sp. CY312]
MIRNYFKVAIRSILRNRISSIVSVVGLSLSMVVGVMIFACLKSNWETDHFHPFITQTFRITTKIDKETNVSRWATCPEPVADELNNMSFVNKTTIVRNGGNIKILARKREIPLEVTFVESSFFEVFGFRLLSGNIKSFFSAHNSVMLGQETAKRLFDNRDPLGERVTIDGWGTFQVAGVIEQPSLKTHIPVEVVLSLDVAVALETKGLIEKVSGNWDAYKDASVYVLTNSENDLFKLNSGLSEISKKLKSDVNNYTFLAQKLEDITPWDPAIQNDTHAGMNWTGIMTWVFLALALTILAAFNYTALSVARIFARAREVGIRKTNGALRKQIFLQFTVESILLSCIALLIAYVVILISRKSGWIGLVKEVNVFPDFQFVGVLLGYTILTGFVAGAIPAFILSRFNPIEVLKSLQTIRFVQRINIYKAIVVVQFSVTIMLMVFFVILRDTGYSVQEKLMTKLPENITIIDLKGKPADRLMDQLMEISQVEKISVSDHLPILNPMGKCVVKIAGKQTDLILNSGFVDHNFIDVFNLKLVAGANFSEDQPQKIEQSILVNQSAGRMLINGESQESNLIGQIVKLDSIPVQIVGVLADDSFQMQEIQPTVFRLSNSRGRFISLKGVKDSDDIVDFKSEKAWVENFPDLIPEIYNFKDRNLSEYKVEMRNVNLSFGLVCGIVIFVSCLGILGMANYAVGSNRMQIGVRKTFGASNVQVIMSVTKPFIGILVVAGIIGIPLGWLCGSLLERRFGFHVDLGMYNLVMGYTLVVLVALMVVVSQTLRSAYINPVEVLKVD